VLVALLIEPGADLVRPLAADAVAVGAKVLWMQLGVQNPEARRIAEAEFLASGASNVNKGLVKVMVSEYLS